MALMRYQPVVSRFGGLTQLHNEINRLFDNLGGTDEEGTPATDWMPAVDVTEEENRYVLHADVPGVDPENIEVTLENGVLTIRGRREETRRAGNGGNGGYRRVERLYGSFFRRFTLPDTADAEKITAQSRNGVLELVIPKQEKTQPRRIAVKS
ncbi:MAG TPA: Hsp20/alpha crystallin family protein [Gammaproteobacteria bacterium]